MIVEATNCNRTYAAKGRSMAADFHSDVIDFKDMPMGSIQLAWSAAAGTLNGEFKVHASNIPLDETFDDNDLDCAVYSVTQAAKSPLWIRDRIGFRYAQVRYTANGVTGGTVDVIALGKKS